MKQTLLYVGNNLIDLLPGTVIAVSIEKIDIGKISQRRASFTNTFDIPPTENNLLALGFPINQNSASPNPYRFLDCKLIQGGVELVPNAKLYITKTLKNIKVTVFENITDFFEGIKGKSLVDLLPIANSAWTAAGIDAARTNTSGIITAVMSWGKSGGLYQYDYFLPCFHYHSIIRSVLESTGLSISGDILTDARFTDLVIPYPGDVFEYDERLNYLNTEAARINTDFSFGVISGSPQNVVFDSYSYGASNWTTNNKYVIESDGEGVTLGIDVSFRITIDTWGDGNNVTVSIAVNGVNTGTDYTLTNPATDSGVQTLTLSDGFLSGDEITLLVESDAPTTDVGVVVKVGTTFSVEYSTTVNRDLVNWNKLLPDIKCDDLVKDFFNRFAVIPKQVNNILYLKTLEEICTDRAGAIDWSDKLVKGIPEIDFGLGYAQNNYFKYQESEDVPSSEIGMGNMAISNEIAAVQKDIFTSIFGNSRLTTNGTYRVALVPVYGTSSTGIATFENKPELRLLTLKDYAGEGAITFDAIARTDYRTAYFLDPIQTKDTGFQYFVDQFYPSLESSLQQNKTITKFFNLTEIDVATYDPHKMIWDGYGYYLPKIDKFIPGKITKVVLFKVN